MKIKSVFLVVITLFAIIISPRFDFAYAETFSPSQSQIVMEKTSGRILSEFNADEKLPMASTTKVITALTVIENFDLNTVITVTEKTANVEGSSVYLKPDDKFTAEDLLYGLMLRSGNDCAETLAVAVAGSIENFCEMMNETAKKYGANNSSFKNPHGLPEKDHYTTARDLCNITRNALTNEIFAKIVSTKKYVATELVSGTKRTWYNKNKLLSSFGGADGVKTGYTKEAGKCYVGSATRNDMQLVCVLLNCPSTYDECKRLFDYAFKNYDFVKLIDKSKFDYRSFTKNGQSVRLKINEDFYYPIKHGEKFTIEQNLPQILPEGLQNDFPIGEIKIYGSKQLIFSQKIYTLIDT